MFIRGKKHFCEMKKVEMTIAQGVGMKDGNWINLHSVYPANNPYITII